MEFRINNWLLTKYSLLRNFLFCNLDKIFKIFHFSLCDLRIVFKLVRARRRHRPIRMSLRTFVIVSSVFATNVQKRHQDLKNVTKFCDQHHWSPISLTFFDEMKNYKSMKKGRVPHQIKKYTIICMSHNFDIISMSHHFESSSRHFRLTGSNRQVLSSESTAVKFNNSRKFFGIRSK